ncbi:MAG: coniferyl aldehyde dehydrogenase [Desulfobacterales bacterium]|jgi:coniferyl-aldehyde dehydrogenase
MENFTSKEELAEKFSILRRVYNENPYPNLAQRKEVLQSLKISLIAHENNFYQALNEDYGYRSEFDTLVADVLPCVMGINYTLKRLGKWMKPSRRHAGIMLAPSRVEVQYQPVGVVGIIVPWNFPVFLALSPATQALAAGNRVMIKLSEFTPNTNKVLIKATQCINDHLVITEGESETGAAFSALPFNHLVFTGSTTVGRYVAKAAADNLTPITLELGGKSPVIFAEDANWETAIDGVILGKAINSGQICVSPDYVLVPRGKEETFVRLFKERYQAYFANAKNKNIQTHIINQKQYERLQGFLADAREKGAEVHVIQEGDSSSEKRILYPHLLTKVGENMEVMKQEIFGPVMPVLPYNSIDECIERINARPRPLALYVMSTNKDTVNKILKHTHSGGACVNDTIMHVSVEDAPFGGIGNSGIGHYHGEEGFRRLSKAKTVLTSKTWLPKNKFFLSYRDLMFNNLRKFLLR